MLNASINMHAYAHIEPTDNGRLQISAQDIEEDFEVRADPMMPPAGPVALHLGVYNRVVRVV